MNNVHWKRLERKTVFTNPWIELNLDKLQLPDGTVIDDYVAFTTMDIVMVVATDSDNNLLTLREYKYPLDQTILTLPAGMIKMHADIDPLQEALRELSEETGYTTDDAKLVQSLNMHCTKNTYKLHIIRARNVKKTNVTQHEVTEFIDVGLMPASALPDSIARGDWTSAETIAALARCGLI
jgi:ADP-ribose pyrophosphatase